jgi:mono/diheme cytochrome c family protein
MEQMKHTILAACLSITSIIACGGGGGTPQTPDDTATGDPSMSGASAPAPTEGMEPGAAPANFGEQAALGQKLYGENCAGCHGDSGEGKDAPPLVGLDKGALPLEPPKGAKYRKTQFKTVADVAEFVVKHMPPKTPGSLPEEHYWAILAFDLKANGIDLGDKKLDPELAKTLEIPRQ